jgi:hypothetical protein
MERDLARSRLGSEHYGCDMTNYAKFQTWADKNHVYAVVETPRGSRAKLEFDPKLGAFTLAKPLLVGLTYPYDWGFIPSTKAEDGDPLDFFFFSFGLFAIVGSWFSLDFGAKKAEFLARGCVGDLHDARPATARFRRLAGAGDAFHSGIFSARAPHLH